LTKKQLKEHLHFIEEAKKRNHRKLGLALDLFSFHDEAPGMALFSCQRHGGLERPFGLLARGTPESRVCGNQDPDHAEPELWERSGHWDNYRENMYFLRLMILNMRSSR
jgi:threonyl-tRNA synthetase